MKEKFDQNKIDRIQYYLLSESQKNAPRYYEIYVDNLKVVSKTNDVNEFDTYQNYITAGVRELKILIYSTALKSHWNKSHEFYFPNEETAPPPAPPLTLSGTEIEQRLSEKINQERQKWEAELREKELEQTKNQLAEAEEYIGTLEKQVTETKKELDECRNKKTLSPEKTLGIAEVLLNKFIGPTDLKGLFGEDGKEQNTPVSEASFSKIPDPSPAEHETYIALLKQLEASFAQPDLNTVMKMLGALIDKPDQLPVIADLLGVK